MIVAESALTSGDAGGGSSSYNTASVTPGANRLVLVAVENAKDGSTDPNTPTLSGNGITWVQVATVLYESTGSIRTRLTLFRGLAALPTGGAITIDLAGQTSYYIAWSVAAFAVVNVATPVVQSAVASGTGTSLAATLAAFGSAANATYGACSHRAGEASSPGSGFAEIHDLVQGGGFDLETEWRVDNDTSVDASWVTSAVCGCIAVEIAAASAGERTVAGRGVGRGVMRGGR